MPTSKSPIAIAERHVADAEQRIADQQARLEKLVRDGHAGRVVSQAEGCLESCNTACGSSTGT